MTACDNLRCMVAVCVRHLEREMHDCAHEYASVENVRLRLQVG
jgi:hypothetical protein